MKVKDLDNILMANRIVIVLEKREIHYVLWSKEETIYKLELPLEKFNSVDAAHKKSPAAMTWLRKRLEASLSIYKDYLV